MQVAVESGEGLNRTLLITIANDEVEEKINAAIQETAKQARINGFRPGKVPLSFVRKRFGPSIREQEVMKLMEQNIDAAIRQEKLDVASITNVEKLKDEAGQNVEYKTEVELYPSIALKDLQGETITDYQVDITDADIDDMLTRLRKQRAEWETVSRAAAIDDQVVIDFEGKVEGQAFEGNSAKDYSLVLGSKSLLPGFEEGIVGHKAGDTFTLDIEFPDDYPSSDVAGKTAVFAITLHAVNQAKLPVLDDAFAKTMGYDEGVDALRAAMREDMNKTVSRALRTKVKEEVIDSLCARNRFDCPQGLLNKAKEDQLQRMQKQHGREGFPEALIEKNARDTERKVKFELIIRDYCREHEVNVDDAVFSEKMAEVVSNSPFANEMLQYILKDPQQRAQIEHMALEEQVVDLLLAKATRSEKTLSYKESLGLIENE